MITSETTTSDSGVSELPVKSAGGGEENIMPAIIIGCLLVIPVIIIIVVVVIVRVYKRGKSINSGNILIQILSVLPLVRSDISLSILFIHSYCVLDTFVHDNLPKFVFVCKTKSTLLFLCQKGLYIIDIYCTKKTVVGEICSILRISWYICYFA